MPTRRSSAASTRIAARASLGSDVRKRVTDERPDVAPGDDHRVDTGSLELEHILTARSQELSDRELAGRDIGKQLKEALEMVLVVVCLLGGKQQDLGIDELEHLFELVLVTHEEHTLDTECVSVLDGLRNAVSVLGYVEDERIDISRLVPESEGEQGKVGAGAQAVGVHADNETFRALLLRGPRTGAVADFDEHGDPVAFRDRLAQPSWARHRA